MDCPHCHTAVPEGARFCLSCGKPMPIAPAEEAAPSNPSAAHPLAGPPSSEGRATERPPGSSPPRVVRAPRLRGARHPLPDRHVRRRAPGGDAPGRRSDLVARPAGAGPRPPSTFVRRKALCRPGPAVTQPALRTAQGAGPAAGMPRRSAATWPSCKRSRRRKPHRGAPHPACALPDLLMPPLQRTPSAGPAVRPPVRPDGAAVFPGDGRLPDAGAAGDRAPGLPEAPRLLLHRAQPEPPPHLDTARRLAAGDYTGLLQMRNTIGKTIADNYRAADDELRRICEQYSVPKSFDIGNTAGGTSILQP